MGLACIARSTLAYGVVVKIPGLPYWPLMLKRLGEIKEEKLPATTTEVDDSEPSAKRTKTTSSILVDYCDVKEDDKKGSNKDEERWDDGAALNYLSDHEDDMQEATRNALDKMLGVGHGLVLKAYYGHDEDSCAVSLLLQIEDDHSCKVDSFEGVSMTPVVPFMRNQENTDTLTKKALDTLIKKALDVFGLEAENENPGWIMATECRLYR